MKVLVVNSSQLALMKKLLSNVKFGGPVLDTPEEVQLLDEWQELLETETKNNSGADYEQTKLLARWAYEESIEKR